MAEKEASREVYQFHILLLKISPAIWRRVLVPSDQNLADFHDTIQIVMGWDDTHLHRFRIHGKDHGIAKPGGLSFSSDPRQVQLCSLYLRIKERFLYEYDFHAFWQHQIRLERVLPFDPTKAYPLCIGGARKAPPDWCNGSFAYLEQKQYFSVDRIGRRLFEIVEDEEALVGNYREEVVTMLFWSMSDMFDRQAVNHRLALFAAGDKRWLETEEVKID